MKFLGLEKKYIAPMVEESFEKLKLSPKMREANMKLEAGDTAGVIPLLVQTMNEEPQNFDVRLTLARIYFEKGHHNDALVMYNKALDIILRTDDKDVILSTYEEIKEKDILGQIIREKPL
jgi:thioredoxin-like negative regulator of GroEL